MGTGVGNFKQGLACIVEPLQPLHGLCSRTVVVYFCFNFSTSPSSILCTLNKYIGALIISSRLDTPSYLQVIGIMNIPFHDPPWDHRGGGGLGLRGGGGVASTIQGGIDASEHVKTGHAIVQTH